MKVKEYNFEQELETLKEFLIEKINADNIGLDEDSVEFEIDYYSFRVSNYSKTERGWEIEVYECPTIDNGFMFWQGSPDWYLVDYDVDLEGVINQITEATEVVFGIATE